MKYYLLVLGLALGYGIETFAQQGSIMGRVIAFQTEEAIEYAAISVYRSADSSLLSGTITNENGAFTVTELPVNQQLFYQVQFMGFQTFSSDPIQVNGKSDVGVVSLQLNTTDLDEVTVTGKAVTVSYQVDKQVYDASQFENTRGGSASDVLSNLPSVSINVFGEIAVRGTTGFYLMINGKPIQGDPLALLQQIPANTIDDIEIVTAPSAKYDPDGKAGIINIKTQTALTDGIFLSANLLAGLPAIQPYGNASNTPRYGADLTFNAREGKWNYSAGLDYRRYDISGRREGYVNTYQNSVLTEFPSDGERSFDETNYSGRLSVAFTPNTKHSYAIGFYAGKRTKERTADILYLNQQRIRIPENQFLGTESYYTLFLENNDVYDGGTPINTNTYYNENLRVRRSDFLISSFDYKHQINTSSSLSFSALYEHTILGGPTDNASLDWPNTDHILQLQFNDNDNPLDGLRLQVDFKHQSDQKTWETGYQFRFLNHPGDFVYFDRDLDNQVWIENPVFTNSIDLTRRIHSVYGQLHEKLNRLSYTAGLRMEYFDREVRIAQPPETYTLNQFNLFPTFNLGFNASEELTLKAGYSRRIERTTTFKMTPFPEREHSETLEQGDAELQPEYIDLVEVGAVKKWGDQSAFATLYYRKVDNIINRVNTVFNDTILNRIYTNVGVAHAYGMEIGTTLFPSSKIRFYAGGNVYNYRIEGTLFDSSVNTSNTIFSINANATYSFSSSFSAQLAFNYLSERVTAQGRDSEFYNPALTIRKTFRDNTFSVAFQWQNIDLGLWDANEQRITTVQPDFFTTTNYVYEVDIMQLTLTYQLNPLSQKIKLPKSEFGVKEF